jgi:lipopolysaccharide biosynthesis protein
MGNRWRHYLLDNLIGSKENLNQLLNQFNDKTIGLIFAADSHSVDISGNKEFADELCEIANLPKIKNSFIFPLGTMFWAKPEALAPFFNCELEQFIQPEPLPYDGTYLHAIERLIPHCALSCGYNLKTVYTKGTRW